MSSKKPLVPSASAGLNKFKMEVANDMAVKFHNEKNKYMGDIPTEVVGHMATAGNIGGEMVKRMIASVEKEMINKK